MVEAALEEKRKSVRRRVTSVLEMQDRHTTQVLGRLMDLSLEGFMLLAKQEMLPHQQYELVLNLPEAIKFHRSIELTAECRWCQPSNTAGYFGAGFSVVNIEILKRNSWKQLVEEF